MILRIRDLVGDDVLAGARDGVTMLAKLIDTLSQGEDAQLAILDFRDIRVATGSYLRESVLGFRNYCRQRTPASAVVIANADSVVAEELRNLLSAAGDALVTCDLSASGVPRNGRVLGTLEEKQRATLDAVLRLGQADARALHEKFHRTETIGVTGWNNRLAALAEKGILIDEREGRAKRFRPVLKELQYGR
jgi:hypothetical protein